MSAKITKACPSDLVVQQVGWPSLTQSALVQRIQRGCIAETESLVARSYGGPHGAAWVGADDDGKAV